MFDFINLTNMKLHTSDLEIHDVTENRVCLMQLACARIGAVHSVVFAGFSAESLFTRILDSRPRVIVTATGSKGGLKVGLNLNLWVCRL